MVSEDVPKKNPHAVALGRRGGKVGGKRRAANMTPEQRSESARKAANARWSTNNRAVATKRLGENVMRVRAVANGMALPRCHSGLVTFAREVVKFLRAKEVPVEGGAWVHTIEDDAWSLVLATPAIATRGPLALWGVLQEYFATVDRTELVSDKITVGFVKPTDAFMRQPLITKAPSVPTGIPYDPPSSSVSSLTSGVTFGPVDYVIVPAW